MLKELKDTDVQYEYLLLDVQSGSELQTSRVVNAIASVQLYVTRRLMNREEAVNPTKIDPKQWECMQHFRGRTVKFSCIRRTLSTRLSYFFELDSIWSLLLILLLRMGKTLLTGTFR